MAAYNIVLIGKTGHGKSSTGNTILKREIFDTFDNAYGGSVFPEKKSSTYNNYPLHVFDTPGLCDSESTEKEDKTRARVNMDLVLNGAKTLAAMILVYKYNTTFTFEEQKTIDILKEFFGEKFLENHGIIVVTGGDLLDKDIPKGETQETFFKTWCSRQKPKFRNLITEVNNRIILVCNKDNFSEGSRRLVTSDKILEMIHNLQYKNGVYTKEEYDNLKSGCIIL